MTPLYLTVVIPSYNEMGNLRKGTLSKVQKYLDRQGFTYEVIIVDLKAQVYKADREYFDSRKDALDFVERYNNNPRKDILGAKTVATGSASR